jgi:hypothetical protein
MSDSNLWAIDGSKIRAFFNGLPTSPQPPPYCAVYLVEEMDSPLQGVSGSDTTYRTLLGSKHNFTYELLMISALKTGALTEQDVINWVRIIKQDVKANYDLKDPYIVGDSKVYTCHPTMTRVDRGTLPNTGDPGVAITLTLSMVMATT